MVGIQFNNNKLFSNKSNLIPKQYQNLINDINQLEKDKLKKGTFIFFEKSNFV